MSKAGAVATKPIHVTNRGSGIETQAKPANTDADVESVIRDIRQAFATGDHLGARELANRGAEDHPTSNELQKCANILAPPKILRTDLPPKPGIGRNYEWLRESGQEYKGQWVALYDKQ